MDEARSARANQRLNYVGATRDTVNLWLENNRDLLTNNLTEIGAAGRKKLL